MFNELCSPMPTEVTAEDDVAEQLCYILLSQPRVVIDVCAPPALAGLLRQLIAKDGARKNEVGR